MQINVWNSAKSIKCVSCDCEFAPKRRFETNRWVVDAHCELCKKLREVKNLQERVLKLTKECQLIANNRNQLARSKFE